MLPEISKTISTWTAVRGVSLLVRNVVMTGGFVGVWATPVADFTPVAQYLISVLGGNVPL